MEIHLRIISSIVSMLVLIGLVLFLKRVGIVNEDHGRIFSKLITQVTLPALIFVSLARSQIVWSEFDLALCMLGAGLICLGLGWLIARALGLEGPQQAPVILATGFGSSSLLGFALIGEVFPGDNDALAEAAILSALGVQPSLFILGTMIAISYGQQAATSAERLRASLRYFHSPIFFAFISGLALSFLLDGVSHPVLESVFDGVHVIGAANTFMVILSVGLMLHFTDLKQTARIGIPVGLVKLLLMPVLLWSASLSLTLEDWQTQVLVLEGAMPSAMLPVVLCSAYGSDAKLASKLVMMTTTISVITIPVIFEVLT